MSAPGTPRGDPGTVSRRTGRDCLGSPFFCSSPNCREWRALRIRGLGSGFWVLRVSFAGRAGVGTTSRGSLFCSCPPSACGLLLLDLTKQAPPTRRAGLGGARKNILRSCEVGVACLGPSRASTAAAPSFPCERPRRAPRTCASHAERQPSMTGRSGKSRGGLSHGCRRIETSVDPFGRSRASAHFSSRPEAGVRNWQLCGRLSDDALHTARYLRQRSRARD